MSGPADVPPDRCNACKGTFHPATGHQLSSTMKWCGPCTRDFYQWVVHHAKRKWSGTKFYA